MILIQLFFEFFKTGLFAVGGGLATLPFLYAMSSATGWFTAQDVANMVAISESTPGPMGVNMSTYVGFTTSGIPGAIIAPLGLICPSVIIIIIISKVLNRFKNSTIVDNIFYGLRPASTALIASAGLGVAAITFFNANASLSDPLAFLNYKTILLAIVLYILTRKFDKIHPIVFIVLSALIGILFQF